MPRKPRTTLQITFEDPGLKKAFQDVCINPNKTLKDFIKSYVIDRGETYQQSQRNAEASEILSVRINEAEKRAINFILEEENKNTSELLQSLVRARISKDPFFAKNERLEFLKAIDQLRAVGVNLNQLVKAIHNKQVAVAPIDEKYAQMLQDQIGFLRTSLHAYINKSIQRDVDNV